MDSRKIVYRETALVAGGEMLLTAAMVGIFGALGYFSLIVLWSGLVGCLIAICNHFAVGVTVSLAADRAVRGEVEAAKQMVKTSATMRLVIMGILLFVALKLGANAVALILPLLFIRPILMLAEFFRKKGD